MNSSESKNVEPFNLDIDGAGAYRYTTNASYSSRIATARQTEEIVRILQKYAPSDCRVLDAGCGDGTFTFKLAEHLPLSEIMGFDPADRAIEVARERIPHFMRHRVRLEVASIYDTALYSSPNSFDVAVLRGVLHHLDDPERAIRALSPVRSIVALEPNGFNPILKVIEKVSPYHRQHGEKSYWPPKLNSWFQQAGYRIIEQRFVSVVPYFCNAQLAKLLKTVEPVIEKMPFISNICCGTNVVFYRK